MSLPQTVFPSNFSGFFSCLLNMLISGKPWFSFFFFFQTPISVGVLYPYRNRGTTRQQCVCLFSGEAIIHPDSQQPPHLEGDKHLFQSNEIFTGTAQMRTELNLRTCPLPREQLSRKIMGRAARPDPLFQKPLCIPYAFTLPFTWL